jgi:hypothetical protein
MVSRSDKFLGVSTLLFKFWIFIELRSFGSAAFLFGGPVPNKDQAR